MQCGLWSGLYAVQDAVLVGCHSGCHLQWAVFMQQGCIDVFGELQNGFGGVGWGGIDVRLIDDFYPFPSLANLSPTNNSSQFVIS